MPRIYYNQMDLSVQRGALVSHGCVDLLALFWLWQYPDMRFAIVLTPILIALFALHSFSQAPLTEGMQRRTYDRLRNKFGADWDLAASNEEFDLARQRAYLEYSLSKVIVESKTTGQLVTAMTLLFMFSHGQLLPMEYFISVFIGWLAYFVITHSVLRWQLRENSDDLRELKQKKSAQSNAINNLQPKTMPRVGMTYSVGDDGELIEVPKQKNA